MTATATQTPPPAAPRAAGGKGGRTRLSVPVILLIVAAAIIVVSAVRAIAGADDVTSSGQIAGALTGAVPIALAGLGGLWSERAGVVNIGLEGMMILGTFFGAWAGWSLNPWMGVLAGVLGGMAGGLLHAIVTVTFGVDQIIAGVAINILAAGVTAYLAKRIFNVGKAATEGGTPKQSPPIEDIKSFTVPGLSHWLSTLEKHHWFLISDLAGIVGGLVTNISSLTLLAVVLFVATFFVLWRTSFGLRLRSCGENPVAAESLGVNVYLYKYVAVTVSGGLAGLGGVFLAIGTHFYLEGQTSGRGYIGLAAMIFGNWRPGGLAMGAGLFGYADSLQLRSGSDSVHALLLLLAVLLLAMAIWKYVRKAYVSAGFALGFAVLLAVWYATTDTVADEIVQASPYVATLLVMGLSAQRLRMPKADGLPYRKGQGG
ncbi:ABC transporter permease [Actinacidiphila bryophytorum]|uniref:Simple sugar transport system permease protein n=1 Tax=Actinacidiphila bryophytorum TaxID=1436133 RepID=A0A9W4GW23_9ACTN|nr:ABC transporter permease [Actinacidiphila bryophytorum]MBM9436459.1 ABC transporter permease [Actinacidiphila bryophytorum]MBN6545869.1 ABC transporter permease [Actinacidiphila bryophytorum]CAG7601376.1 Simple sugar transport system permease protein [Actinacidiphila bryophytorum]